MTFLRREMLRDRTRYLSKSKKLMT